MLRALTLLILTAVILHTSPAWSETESRTFKLSVTIPASVGNNSVQSNHSPFLAQEQRAVRNNQAVVIRSIVLL